MPRPKAKQETMAEQMPDPEAYSDYQSALIKYGILVWSKRKDQKLLAQSSPDKEGMDLLYGSANGLMAVPMDIKQVQYLNMRMSGFSLKDICKALDISPAVPSLWKESEGADSVYGVCLDAINEINADVAEDITRDEAQTNRKANLERMFYVKRWKPEYRDNFQGSGANIVQLNITVGDQPYTVDVNTKAVNANGET